ncbi:putative exopolysaccharide biosynthesis protein [Sinorhizobium fredii NGR234]|uniref:Exopolysaccharide biosynthesis protein n=1 Tax=Sinorhizobium fredii (strain NBRC 101917 / NGR234) TaxID=394 RepID=C3MDH4_SINFN|nr:thermonuclease family protein [Sinorhizobium fredii]ACP25493.1 putative exopolysaccharide biosynthesis protein [Sinorhizobium fredii NGR234]
MKPEHRRFRIVGGGKPTPSSRRFAFGRPGNTPPRKDRRQGRGSLIGGWVFLLLLSLGAYVASRLPPPEAAVTGELRGAAVASDGDSLRLSGRRVRVEGIDAPEIGQTCRRDGARWNCGAEAQQRLEDLVGGTTTRCRLHGHDRYGRELGLCEAGGRDIGREMVLSGHAVSYGLYREEEALARDSRAGLWAGDFVRPQEWRRSQGKAEEAPHRAGDWLELIVQWLEDEAWRIAKEVLGA